MRRVLSLCLVLVGILATPAAAAPGAAPTLTGIFPGYARIDGGTVLTLRGTGFTAGITVDIDGIAATVFRLGLSTTSVGVIAPAHAAGGVTVTVTNTLLESVSQSSLLTYVAWPVIGAASPIVRASLSAAGAEGTLRALNNLGSRGAKVSGDGSIVAFTSDNDLGLSAAGKIAVYVKNLNTGSLALASACGDCAVASTSLDGSRVGFIWFGAGGVRTAHFADAPFTGSVSRIDVSQSGALANAPSGGPLLSADGRYAAFTSAATNLEGTVGDTASTNDLFVKDLQSNFVERWTLGKNITSIQMSADARLLVFVTTASLLASDTNAVADTYSIDRTVGAGSLSLLTAGVNNITNGALSGDGASLAFTSAATDLVANDTNGVGDVFVLDVASGAVSRVSVATDGTEASAVSGNPTISANGRFVAFPSRATNLVSGSLQNLVNLFVRDRLTNTTYIADAAADGTLEDATLSTSPPGTPPSAPSVSAQLSADGRTLAFETLASNLVNDDTNAILDIYVKTMPPDTPIGTGVPINPVDPVTGGSPITLTFDQVVGGGVTSLSTSPVGPPVPVGFQLSGSTFFEVSTTAQFNGTVTLCLNYSTMGVADADALRLLHYANDLWNDITTSNDTDAKIICGATTSFSPFAIAEQFDVTPPVIEAHDDVTAAATSPAGAIVSYDVPLAQDDLAGPVAVTCSPASGSLFVTGGTVVNCAASDPAGNSGTSSFLVTIVNSAPTATSVSITGTLTVGQILTGQYTYGDVNADLEGASTFRWLRNGTTAVGTSATYTLVAADAGQSITFEVTPLAATGTSPGAPATSDGVTIDSGVTTLVSITVTPVNPSILRGASVQFTATGLYSDGSTQDITLSVVWSSSKTAVATIDSTGQASGVGIGTATIKAKLGAVSATTRLTVRAPALLSITVTPVAPSIRKGATQQFKATGTYSDGTTKNLTKEVNWSSSDPSVARIDRDGRATAREPGATTITATSEGIADATTLTVTRR